MRNCTKLLRVAVIKDHGVFLISSLSFSVHIDFDIKKAIKVLGCVALNCKSFHNTSVLKSLYFSLVRPHLEFAALTRYLVNIANIIKQERCSNDIYEIFVYSSICHLNYSLHD